MENKGVKIGSKMYGTEIDLEFYNKLSKENKEIYEDILKVYLEKNNHKFSHRLTYFIEALNNQYVGDTDAEVYNRLNESMDGDLDGYIEKASLSKEEDDKLLDEFLYDERNIKELEKLNDNIRKLEKKYGILDDYDDDSFDIPISYFGDNIDESNNKKEDNNNNKNKFEEESKKVGSCIEEDDSQSQVMHYFSHMDNILYQDLNEDDQLIYLDVMENYLEVDGYGFTHRFEEFLKRIDDDSDDIEVLNKRLNGSLEDYMEYYTNNKEEEEELRLITLKELEEEGYYQKEDNDGLENISHDTIIKNKNDKSNKDDKKVVNIDDYNSNDSNSNIKEDNNDKEKIVNELKDREQYIKDKEFDEFTEDVDFKKDESKDKEKSDVTKDDKDKDKFETKDKGTVLVDAEDIGDEKSVELLDSLLNSELYLKIIKKFIVKHKPMLDSKNIEEITISKFELEGDWVSVDLEEEDENGKKIKVRQEVCIGIISDTKFIFSNGEEVRDKIKIGLHAGQKGKKFYIRDTDFGGLQELLIGYEEGMRKDIIPKIKYRGITVYLLEDSKESKEFVKRAEEFKKNSIDEIIPEDSNLNKLQSTEGRGKGLDNLQKELQELNQRVVSQVDGERIKKMMSMFGMYMYGLAQDGFSIKPHPSFKGVYVVSGNGYFIVDREIRDVHYDVKVKNKNKNNFNTSNRTTKSSKGKQVKTKQQYTPQSQSQTQTLVKQESYGKGEVLLITPYYVIAFSGNTLEYQVVYNRLNGTMNLKELELMLINHGYPMFKDISYALNLKNYGTFNVFQGSKNIVQGVKKDGGIGLIKTAVKKSIMERGDKDGNDY